MACDSAGFNSGGVMAQVHFSVGGHLVNNVPTTKAKEQFLQLIFFAFYLLLACLDNMVNCYFSVQLIIIFFVSLAPGTVGWDGNQGSLSIIRGDSGNRTLQSSRESFGAPGGCVLRETLFCVQESS